MHVNAFISFTAVSLEVEFTKFLLLIRDDKFMFKLALLPLYEDRIIDLSSIVT